MPSDMSVEAGPGTCHKLAKTCAESRTSRIYLRAYLLLTLSRLYLPVPQARRAYTGVLDVRRPGSSKAGRRRLAREPYGEFKALSEIMCHLAGVCDAPVITTEKPPVRRSVSFKPRARPAIRILVFVSGAVK